MEPLVFFKKKMCVELYNIFINNPASASATNSLLRKILTLRNFWMVQFDFLHFKNEYLTLLLKFNEQHYSENLTFPKGVSLFFIYSVCVRQMKWNLRAPFVFYHQTLDKMLKGPGAITAKNMNLDSCRTFQVLLKWLLFHYLNVRVSLMNSFITVKLNEYWQLCQIYLNSVRHVFVFLNIISYYTLQALGPVYTTVFQVKSRLKLRFGCCLHKYGFCDVRE